MNNSNHNIIEPLNISTLDMKKMCMTRVDTVPIVGNSMQQRSAVTTGVASIEAQDVATTVG